MKRILIIVFIVAAAIISCIFIESAQKNIRDGNKLYKHNKYKEASDKYTKAIKKDKSLFIANYNYANALYKQNMFNFSKLQYDTLFGRDDIDSLRLSYIHYNSGNAGLKILLELIDTIEYFKNEGTSLIEIKRNSKNQPERVKSAIKLDTVIKTIDSLEITKKNTLNATLNAYKNALKHNDTLYDAKYNLSYTLSLLPDLNDNSTDNNKNEQKEMKPTEFALKLKAEADSLVSQFLFNEAHKRLNQGLKKDSTISTYNEFINKLDSVNRINNKN